MNELEKLKAVWFETPIEVQRAFLFEYINANFKLVDLPSKEKEKEKEKELSFFMENNLEIKK